VGLSKPAGRTVVIALACCVGAGALIYSRFAGADDKGSDAQPAGAKTSASVKPADMKPFTQSIPGTEASFDLVPIPGGSFRMGSPTSEPKRHDDEGPQVEVEVDPFYMGKYEVTWSEYEPFLQNYPRLAGLPSEKRPAIPADKMGEAVTYPTPMYELEAGPKLDKMGRGGKYPAVIMSQYAARQYCKWLSKKTGRFYRLPTEAEWEYAARAGTTTAYSFGDDPKKLGDYAWTFDNSENEDKDTVYREVGQKKPNPWGLYDIHGNVAEWCIDQYASDWYKQFAGKKVNWHDTINWPSKQHPRAIRGGGYESEAEDCRSARRIGSDKKFNIKDPQLPQSPHWLTEGFWIGFRVVAPVKEPPEAEKVRYWDADDPTTLDILKRDRELREVIEPPKPVAGAGR
jgi:formylglycine-generating enzyme required for sulfatase activity